MLPKSEVGHTGDHTVLSSWFWEEEQGDTLGSAEHEVSHVPPVKNPVPVGEERQDAA